MINLLHGDCLEQMKTLDDNSVDSIREQLLNGNEIDFESLDTVEVSQDQFELVSTSSNVGELIKIADRLYVQQYVSKESLQVVTRFVHINQ